MNKIVQNVRYKTNYQLTWVAWYLAIYIVVIFLVFYGLIKTSLISQSSGSLVYRLWGIVLFQFAISMRFREDFDFWLILSNTRKAIFQSQVGVGLAFSALFSALIVIERLVIDYLNGVFGFNNIEDPFHFFAPYSTDNLFLLFLFFFMMCVCCSVFGLMMGSLFYRYGRGFILAFWLVFSSIPLVFLPLLLWPVYLQGNLRRFFDGLGKFLMDFNVLSASGYLAILTAGFCMAAYINIRRLPQK